MTHFFKYPTTYFKQGNFQLQDRLRPANNHAWNIINPLLSTTNTPKHTNEFWFSRNDDPRPGVAMQNTSHPAVR
jgi:hypothetical protein